MSRSREEYAKLVDEARNNVNQNSIGGDEERVVFQFGSSTKFGNKYWTKKPTPKINTGFSFLTEGLFK